MTSAPSDIAGAMPSDSQFHSESIHALEICRQHCHCHDHWHFIWAGMKAAGLRRGVYLQQHLFNTLLSKRRNTRQRVLIAGSADAGALQVLHHALGSGDIDYHAIDRCQSPLQLLAEYAQAQGIRLTTGISNIQSLPQGPWDVILVHNTLVFLSEQERIETLKRMATSLSDDGIILCGMRYNNAPQKQDPATIEKECERTEAILSRTFPLQPEILDMLSSMVAPFVQGLLTSLSHRATRVQFHSELSATGLRIVESCPDQRVLPSALSDLNDTLNVEAELMLLQAA